MTEELKLHLIYFRKYDQALGPIVTPPILKAGNLLNCEYDTERWSKK